MKNVSNGDLQALGVANAVSSSQAYPSGKLLNFDNFTTV
jgi:hypothetical protein